MTVQPPLPVLPEVYSSLTKAQRHILRNPKIPGVQLAAHETAGDKGPTSQVRTLVAPVRGLRDHPFAQEDGTASVLENFVPTLTGVEIRPGVKRLTPVAQETTNSQLIEHSRADEPPGVSPMLSFIDPEEDNIDVVYVMGGNSVVLGVKEPEPPPVYYEIDGGIRIESTINFVTRSDEIEFPSDISVLRVTDLSTGSAINFPVQRPANTPDIRIAIGSAEIDGSDPVLHRTINLTWPLTADSIAIADIPIISSENKLAFVELQRRDGGEWVSDNHARVELAYNDRGGDTARLDVFSFDTDQPTSEMPDDGIRVNSTVSVVARDNKIEFPAGLAVGSVTDIGTNTGITLPLPRYSNAPDIRFAIGSNDTDGSNRVIYRTVLLDWPLTTHNISLAEYPITSSDSKILFIELQKRVNGEWTADNNSRTEVSFNGRGSGTVQNNVFGVIRGGAEPILFLDESPLSDPECVSIAVFDGADTTYAILVDGANFPRRYDSTTRFKSIPDVIAGDDEADEDLTAAIGTQDNIGPPNNPETDENENLAGRRFYYQKGGKGTTEENLGMLIEEDSDKVASNLDIRPQDFSYVFAFKSRLFFIEKNSTNAWYLGVLNVSGPVSKLPLGGVLPFNSSILFGLAWSTQWGDDLADRAIFVTEEGHIAAYHGTPGLDSFELQGVYRIAPPLGKHAHFQFGGDAYVLTGDGVVSLNALVQGQSLGSGSPYITDPIRTLWRALARERKTSCYWRTAVWASRGLAFVFNNDPEFNETLMFGVNLFQFTWFNVKFNKLLAAQMANGGERDHLVAGLATVGDQCYLVDSWGNLYTFGAGRDEYFYYVAPVDAEDVQPTEGDQTAEVKIDAIACMTPINHGSNVRATDMRTLWRGDPIEDVKSLLPPVLPGELEKENIRPWPAPKSAEDSRANPRRWSRVPRRITKAQEEFASPTVQVAVERELEPTSELTHIEYRVTDAGT